MTAVCKFNALIGICVLAMAGSSCRTSINVDAAWERAAARNTKEALVAFVRAHRDTRHTPDALAFLERHATAREDYAVAAIRPPKESPRTVSRARITENHGGFLGVGGMVEHELDPLTGRLGSMF